MLTSYSNTLCILNAKQGIKKKQNFIAEQTSNTVFFKKRPPHLKKGCFKNSKVQKKLYFTYVSRAILGISHCQQA